MNQNAHIVTLIDLRNDGVSPKQVFCFSSREKAVKKMRELYRKELEKYGLKEEDVQEDDTWIHGDFPNPPFIPYAYCNETYIDYYKSDIQ